MEILLEKGGKLLEGGVNFSSLVEGTSTISRRVEKRMELDSPRLGLSRRIQEVSHTNCSKGRLLNNSFNCNLLDIH